jgi:chromosome segregation ATPase
VEVAERKVENQVQFWALLGPFVVLLSIAILLFKVSDHWYIPLSALVGIPLCVKWQMKGMAASLVLLSILLLSNYQDLELGERYWHIGLSLAMAFSFIILTLSLEEAQGLLQKLQLESDSRLENFIKLDQKWKEAEAVWEEAKDALATNLKALSADIAKVQEEKQTFYKLAQLAKDELVLIRTHHEQLLQDLTYKKQQIAQLNERVEETELTIQGFLDTDSEQQIEYLTASLASAEEEHEALKRDKAALETKIAELETEWQASEKEKICLAHELQHSQEREQGLAARQEEDRKHLNGMQSRLKELEDSYFELTEEKEQIAQQEKILREELNECKDQFNSFAESHKKLDEKLSSTEMQLQQRTEELLLLKHQYEEQLAVHAEQQLTLQTEYKKQLAQQSEHQLSVQKEFEQKLAQQAEHQIALQREYEQKLATIPREKPANNFEAKYLQLREQFNEKSEVLNATRRELFHLQERILGWEKEQEENTFTDLSAHETFLLRDLLKLSSQFDQMRKLYQAEIDELTYTISCLFRQL